MPRRIKPEVEEISLAFNPANTKKFYLRKDYLTKGGIIMPKAVDVLTSQDKMFKEAEFVAFLDTLKKDQFTDEDREMILGSFKLLGMVKDRMPEDFIEGLTKAIPELKTAFTIIETKEIPADDKKLRKDIRKEIEAELRKELKLEKDEAVVKLEGVVETLRKELTTTVTALDTEREIREIGEIKNFIKEKNVPGDVEKVARTIFLAKKANPELGKDLEAVLESAGTALTAAGAFSELGKSSDGTLGNTAYEQLQKKVAEVMEKDTTLNQAKAWEKVIRQNTALYKQYTDEHAAQAKEVH